MIALLLAVVLTWTAPGDDGGVGTAAQYDIRYGTDSTTVARWTSATQATGEPAPHAAGTTETFSLTRPPGTWWFALRTRDEAGNESATSNLVSKVVADSTSTCAIVVDGDVNRSGSLTSSDLIYLTNYCFRGMAPPAPCVANGDVNCSGTVTSTDIIYLVAHLFKSGAPPCDICLNSPLKCT